MSQIPPEARDALMRAWLDILRRRHPNVTWIDAKSVEYGEELRDVAHDVLD